MVLIFIFIYFEWRDTENLAAIPQTKRQRARKISLGHFVPWSPFNWATCREPARIWLAVTDFQNRVLKCDIIKNEISEIMGFVRIL